MAIIYAYQRDYSNAFPMYEKALSIYLETLSAERPQVVNLYNAMASTYMNQEDSSKASSHSKKVLIIALEPLV